MKIRVEHGEYEENEIVIRCRQLDDEMLEIIALLRDTTAKLMGYREGEAHVLQPSSICYAEAVDGRTFIYTIDSVFEVHKSLSGLLNYYAQSGLIRIGKSTLLNLYRVIKLKSLPNSRVEVTLQNGEKLIVSRHYVQNLKEELGMLD